MKKPPAAPNGDVSAYTIEDPEEFARNMLQMLEQGGRVLSQYLDRADSKPGPYSTASEIVEAGKTVNEVFALWASDPAKLAEAQTELFRSYAVIWNNALRRMLGDNEVEPYVEPEKGDNRFADPDWSENPYFDFWKQSYLITSKWAEDLLAGTQGLDERERQRAEYHFRQLISAMSPSNFPMTNPEVVRETFSSNAKNLVRGMDNLFHDMERSGDLLKISQTDLAAFEVGRNLATTPGKVVFQNDIMQLLQYAPSTPQVRQIPLLVVPPWINKFYILDLTPAKSFIKFAVDQGFTVFVISWVNPDRSLAEKDFQDYMHEGVLTAADVIRRETGEERINGLGYCVGGTLLATTLAYLSTRGEDIFASATFLTTQVDFTKAGDLLLFIDDAQLKSLEEMMAERGYLDGSRMANVFNMMRPKDLVWPYVVNNYLLGKQPFPFDLLYWNQDSTRMPAANHRFYLREFYHQNRLARGEMEISGTQVCLSDIRIPVFDLGTKEDHIAPAQSVFIGAKLLGGPVEFVLAGSGHIAGVVNPPEKVKYQYWTSKRPTDETLDEWVSSATEHTGSWWPYWTEWLTRHSGEEVPAREPGANLGAIEDAPGSYVKVRA
ncbi:Poly-beta-hydroxybutyrate polymerase [Candidatus Filomicrobium marinum]|uniref:Poly-beta-hydroxybutyrate polymerase n=2 Tax=Filomicrobium TaxID=119044 RepID=A0A0D6JB13_9HYPH|nr:MULTISPECIES: class I poly(R)-hydroxyalkanoic acid synthase [Filomicrobium]CFX03236.1 Poly-beta-hydroxybutyrate polymerase [Candidatus Filomicrobium marinum]CPR15806.1 Poly-beta-hydroxybutyrate polymerase [Candidatus Filomicrobium marinum]SDP39145.1 polyhydroxyalkanoate synthase [Filomicrobium insigne]